MVQGVYGAMKLKFLQRKTFCCAALVAVSLAGQYAFAGVTQKALRLELNQTGLGAIAREVELRFLHDIDNAPIGDMTRHLASGWDLATRGLRYSVDFRGLALRATKQGIQIDFAVNDVSLTAESIELTRPFLWWHLSSKCHGVDINVSGPDDLALTILIEPFIASGGHLDARIKSVDFGIDPDSYFVRGPDSCSGLLGFNNYLRNSIASVLAGASNQVSEIVRRQVSDLLPEGIAGLDAMLHQSFDVDIGFPGAPISRNLVLQGEPESIEFGEGRMNFVMNSDISAIDDDAYLQHAQPERRNTRNIYQTAFASIGLNKQVINDALVEIHPGADIEFEVSREKFPQIAAFLNREMLSAVWPDLNELILDSSNLRAFASFPEVPSIEPSAQKPGETWAGVDVNVPNAKLTFQVRQDGLWIDYAFVNVRLNIPLTLEMTDGELEVAFRDLTAVEISGGWSPGYRPRVDIFEADLAQAVVKTIFETLYLQGPLMKLLVPIYDFGGGHVGFSNPRTEYPYFAVDLISALGKS